MTDSGHKSLGLYIHIPFCATKCSYCDFPSQAGRMALRAPYVDALTAEIAARGQALGNPAVDTVYIGGGTPSLLQPEQMSRVLVAAHAHFRLSDGCEISCEANPGMLSARFLAALRAGGVNRLSLGAQSADDSLLPMLGRRHSWAQVVQAVHLARQHGFDNINIDLMMGIPGQTPDNWQDTLEAALAFAPEHLSCYGLIVEEGTPLADRVAAGALSLPPEEAERAMYDHTLRRLARAGYTQYEVSNFARPGRACLHNLHCWQRADYVGVGAAAHSLVGGDTRLSNPADIDAYLAGYSAQVQRLTAEERRFESVMLGLRTTAGVDLAAFEAMHGLSFQEAYGDSARKSLEQALAVYTPDGFFRLTRRGMDVMNTVLLDFL